MSDRLTMLQRCADALVNGTPMRIDGELVEGYVTVHVLESFRDEVIEASRTGMDTILEKHPWRRVGAVLGITTEKLLVWVNGVTPDEGVWIDRKWIPPVLHTFSDDATFDVWLADGEPLEHGRFAPQRLSPLAFKAES